MYEKHTRVGGGGVRAVGFHEKKFGSMILRCPASLPGPC